MVAVPKGCWLGDETLRRAEGTGVSLESPDKDLGLSCHSNYGLAAGGAWCEGDIH